MLHPRIGTALCVAGGLAGRACDFLYPFTTLVVLVVGICQLAAIAQLGSLSATVRCVPCVLFAAHLVYIVHVFAVGGWADQWGPLVGEAAASRLLLVVGWTMWQVVVGEALAPLAEVTPHSDATMVAAAFVVMLAVVQDVRMLFWKRRRVVVVRGATGTGRSLKRSNKHGTNKVLGVRTTEVDKQASNKSSSSGGHAKNSSREIKYYDPRTWPASYTEADIKTLLQDKLNDPTKPPKYTAMATLLRSTDPERFDAVTQLMHNVKPQLSTPRSLLDLEEAVRSWLSDVKEGSLFAADPSDQERLDAVMRYLEECEAAQENRKKQKNSGKGKGNSGVAAPLFGGMPFVASASVKSDVRRHVVEHETEFGGTGRVAFLCNSGCAGSGKTTLLYQSTAEGVRAMRVMVNKRTVGSAEQHRWRPLGFYVTFNTRLTDFVEDKVHQASSRDVPILTFIALRMAYSVLAATLRDSGEVVAVPHYGKFAKTLLSFCDLDNDESNFECIVGALRKALQWDGPMFIAIDELARAVDTTRFNVRDVVSAVCVRLLDNAKPLRISDAEKKLPLSATDKLGVYERYVCASVYDAVDTVHLATGSARPIISQPMPLLGVRQLASSLTTWIECSSDKGDLELPSEYIEVFGPRRVGDHLTARQLLFLIHLSLASGNPRALGKCLSDHAEDVDDEQAALNNIAPRFYHPGAVRHMFWARERAERPSPELAKTLNGSECRYVAEMIVGASEVNIFKDEVTLPAYRVFVLNPILAIGCTIASVSPTRVLVSPFFMRSVERYWPDEHSSMLQHFRAFRRTVERHVKLTAALVATGDKLVLDPMPPVCEALVEQWKAANVVGFEDSTLDAIFLHLSCVLHSDGLGSSDMSAWTVLEPISTIHGGTSGLTGAVLCRGPLERIEVPNFPLCFVDAFALVDSQRNHDDALAVCSELGKLCPTNAAKFGGKNVFKAVNALKPAVPAVRTTVGTASHEVLQSALAAGQHFCFKPSNPDNFGEDGVVFLREESAKEHNRWVVLLIQNKYWFDETQRKQNTRRPEEMTKENVVDVWRRKVGHLPGTMKDTHGAVHTLRYVRMLVTANPVRSQSFERPAPPLSSERRDLLARANAAFMSLDPARREEVGMAATEWNTEQLKTSSTRKVCRQAGIRADWLLRCRDPKDSVPAVGDAPECGPVIAECHMDIDKITEWCATAGLFAGNIVHIQNLSNDSTLGKVDAVNDC
jgi:hypothetical protein